MMGRQAFVIVIQFARASLPYRLESTTGKSHSPASEVILGFVAWEERDRSTTTPTQERSMADQSLLDAAFLEETMQEFLHASDLSMTTTRPCDASTVSAVSRSFKSPVGNALENRTGAASRLTKHEHRRAKDRMRRRLYLERRKRERGVLRHQVAELSAKLQTLEETKDDVELPTSIWMAIAQRQMDAVHVAKTRQRQLRAAISTRTAIIEELSGLMRSRLHDVVPMDEEADEELCRRKQVRFNVSDTMIFEGYLQELDAVYAQTDAVFQDCAMDSATRHIGSFQATRKTNGVTEYFQLYDTHLLSFDYLQTCRSAWISAFRFRCDEDRKLYEEVEDPANTMAMKLRVAGDQTVPPLLQRIVARRYQETDRTVFVWRALTEGEGIFAGLHADETGWCVIRPCTAFSETGTILETCIRQVPMHLEGAARLEAVSTQFTDVVLSSGTEDAVETVSKLERVLLDEALENFEC
ncbi:hypothetical protein BBJ28_00019009 [Nothophytophthora sp. Chile5]|nr:hypothetical protein BBJ28_00019009 [Nothophytophthora sp. Chile5]